MRLPAAPSPCPPAGRARLLSLGSLLLATVGCFSAGSLGHGEPAVTGSLALAGPVFGAREVAPVACHSGERQLFLGADFVEGEERADGLTARLVVDPLSGPAVRIAASAAPFGPALIVHRADCSVFQFSLAQAGWRLNDYWVYTVSVELDCALPSGDGVAGKLLAPTCW